MAFREVRVHEVREVLPHWVGSELGQRPIAERAGVDRKTARRYIEAAVGVGVVRDGGLEQLTDELLGQVINACGQNAPRGMARRGTGCSPSRTSCAAGSRAGCS